MIRNCATNRIRRGLSVTVAVPTAEETKAIYGVDLAEKLIQSVWIKIKNDTPVPYWFLSSGLDPNYFSSSEAAYAFHAASDEADRAWTSGSTACPPSSPKMRNRDDERVGIDAVR